MNRSTDHKKKKKSRPWLKPAIAVFGFFACIFLGAFLASHFRVMWIVPVTVIVALLWGIIFSVDFKDKG